MTSFGIEVRAGANLQGFLLVAIALGVGYHYLVNKSRFGYDLRASGINPTAANASGVDPKKMIIRTMLISGGLAGLVGIAPLLGFYHQYPQDFPPTSGSTASPWPCSAGTTRSGWPSAPSSSGSCKGRRYPGPRDVPKEIVTIIQGIVVLAVVIVYEVVSKYVQRHVIASASAATDVDPVTSAEAA